jgi:hypothetical protein
LKPCKKKQTLAVQLRYPKGAVTALAERKENVHLYRHVAIQSNHIVALQAIVFLMLLNASKKQYLMDDAQKEEDVKTVFAEKTV